MQQFATHPVLYPNEPLLKYHTLKKKKKKRKEKKNLHCIPFGYCSFLWLEAISPHSPCNTFTMQVGLTSRVIASVTVFSDFS
jgi:hypothetical protein